MKKVFHQRTWGVLVVEYRLERASFFEYDLGTQWVLSRVYRAKA